MSTCSKPLCFVVLATIAISACAAFQPAGAGKGARRMGPTEPASPWQLRLETNGPLGLRLTLRNNSSSAQTYLHDRELQPTELLVTDAAGRQIKGFDERSNAKFDNTVHRNDYQALKPGKEKLLCEASFTSSGGRYELRWDTFRFNGLAPGKYKVQAVWKSEKSKWREPDENKSGVISGIWLGTVNSNTVEVTLP